MKSKYAGSIVVLIAVLFAAAGVKAAEECLPLPPLPSYAVPVERACTIKLSLDGSKYARILAGPDATQENGLATAFPLTCKNGVGQCSCGDAALNPTCLEWQYQWKIIGFPAANLGTAMISAGSNVSVYSSNPVGATVLQPLIAKGERFIQFSVPDGMTFSGAYYTPLNITPGTLTAGFTGKNGRIPLLGRCALAGASFVTVSQNQALPAPETKTFSTAGGCVFSLNVDPASGKAIPGTIKLIGGSPDDCSISETYSMQIDGNPLVYVSAGQWTEEGSCKYCQTNTYGGKTCATCSTCIIRNGVCVRP